MTDDYAKIEHGDKINCEDGDDNEFMAYFIGWIDEEMQWAAVSKTSDFENAKIELACYVHKIPQTLICKNCGIKYEFKNKSYDYCNKCLTIYQRECNKIDKEARRRYKKINEWVKEQEENIFKKEKTS
jgi:hypothetical protein